MMVHDCGDGNDGDVVAAKNQQLSDSNVAQETMANNYHLLLFMREAFEASQKNKDEHLRMTHNTTT